MSRAPFPSADTRSVARSATGTVWGVSRALRIAIAVLLAGLLAGLAGGLLSLTNAGIETLAMGHHYFLDPIGVAGVPLWRRLSAPLIGGVIAGLIWWRLRRRGPIASVNQAVKVGSTTRLTPATLIDALAQLIVVGSGTSLGRETAPRQVAGFLGQAISDRIKLGPEGRRTVIATASAAGLSAVYNVPAAGMFYALELILKPDLKTRRGWLEVLAAAGVSVLATMTAWLFNHNDPIYRLPSPTLAAPMLGRLAGSLVVVAVVALVVGAAFGWTNDSAKSRTPPAHRVWWAVPLGSALVTAIAVAVPQVPGNGQIVVQAVLTPPGVPTGVLAGGMVLGGVLLMGVAKWVATHIALRLGANGGLLTPALALGACLGAAVGLLSGHRSPSEIAVLAVVGAACLLAVTQRAPLFAAAFALELVKAPPVMIAAAVIGVALTWAARWLVLRGWARWRATAALHPGTPSGN